MNREAERGVGRLEKAKEKYRNKIETTFSGGSLRAAWQGIKNMAAVNKNSGSGRSKVNFKGVNAEALPNVLNTFFIRFETHDFPSEIAAVKQLLIPDNTTMLLIKRLCLNFSNILM